MKLANEVNPPLADTLEHFGVKGMRWGVRRNTPDASGVTRKDARKASRALNKETRRKLEDFDEYTRPEVRNAQIKAARAIRNESRKELRDVERGYKEARQTQGKNAAKIALREAQEKNYRIQYKADAQTTGEEAFVAAVSVGFQIANQMAAAKQAKERQP